MSFSQDPYATKVLDKKVHDRLVADLPSIAQVAGISPHWVWTPLADTVGPEELEWVRDYNLNRDHGVCGLCYVGSEYVQVADRMSAITGALLRNFINAQMFTVTALLDRIDSGNPPTSSCLLIPNFYLGKKSAASVPGWKVAILQDFLLDRQTMNRPTVIHCDNLPGLAEEYGKPVHQLVTQRYKIAQI